MTTSPTSQSELPERDRELLSAYIDNQLTLAERATLERRLAGDPTLRRELAELRATRDLLRDQPWVAPPRSFTLTPEMVSARRRAFTLPAWLQPLSGLVALVVVMLIGWQVIGLSTRSTLDNQSQAMAAPTNPPAAAAAVPLEEPTVTADLPMAAVAESAQRNPSATGESIEALTAPSNGEHASNLSATGAGGQAGPPPEAQRQTTDSPPTGPPLPLVIGLVLLLAIAAGIWWMRRNAE
ncbi:anti-sigma factor family protein [Chloroflexus sp.]|uniref:anti-sigma factor family protein n=1 Tax=Chloroflexus sp. TaxID=1904827 RepID=UPI002608138D|nr:anti-sigma factor [uncultured Chloroflexus sp.]